MGNQEMLESYLKAFEINDHETQSVKMQLEKLRDNSWNEAMYQWIFAKLAARYTHDIKQVTENIKLRKSLADSMDDQISQELAEQIVNLMLLVQNLHGNHIGHLNELYDISNQLLDAKMAHICRRY